MNRISIFLQNHFPIWNTNPTFCLIVLGLIGLTALYWFQTRSRPSLVVLAAEACYLLPFIRA